MYQGDTTIEYVLRRAKEVFKGINFVPRGLDSLRDGRDLP